MKKRLNIALILSGAMLFFATSIIQAQSSTVKPERGLEVKTQNAGSAQFLKVTSNNNIVSYDFTMSAQENMSINETNVGSRIFLKRGGNIGINNDNPQAILDVNGDSKFVGRMELINAPGKISIFIGKDAGLNNNVNNGDNVFIGFESGLFNDTGSFNTFLGTIAGRNNTTGSWNTFLGRSAGFRNTTGSDNTFVGKWAGLENTVGSRNTFLGTSSGLIALGDSTAESIAIGYNAKVECSNCAVIGGTGDDAVNVGIGLTTPTESLEVNGNAKATKFIGDGSMLTNLAIDDADADPNNEIQDLELINNTLKITSNTSATNIDLSPYLDDTQLTESEVDNFVSNNGYLTSEVDGSTSNELQDLELNGNILSLTDDATSVDLSNFENKWTETSGDVYRSNGRVGIGMIPTNTLSVIMGANGILDVEQNIGTSFATAAGSRWQSFTANTSENLVRVVLPFQASYLGIDRVLSIYAGEGTTGTLLFTSNIVSSTSSTSFEITGVQLTSGNKYTIALDDGRGWFISTSDVYSGGRSESTTNRDYRFQTYVSSGDSGFNITDDAVGIGTNTPDEKLEVVGNVKATNFIGDGSMLTNLPSSSSLWTENGSDIYRNTGNIGIGTTTPNHELNVVGDTELDGSDNDGTTNATLKIKAGSQTMLLDGNEIDVVGGNTLFLNGNAGGDVSLGTSTSGNVGIGTSTPQSKLDVNGETGTVDLKVANIASIGGNGFSNVKLTIIAGDEFGQIIQNNSAGVATTRLDNTGGGLALEISNGNAAKPGGGSWAVSSDRRLKKDVSSYQEGLDILRKVNPVWFRYNGKEKLPSDTKYAGVIAQELQAIAPHMVTTRKGEELNEYLMVDPSAFTYMLINAVQELDEKVSEKDEKIEKLEARLAKIEAMLSGNTEERTIITDATLQQNAPNPFTEATNIDYFIPEGVKNASLQVMDQNGRIIKRIPIQATGNGQITLQANLLSAGTYSYSLILDGRVMETKQMVLTH